MREIRTSGLTSGDGKRGVATWLKPPRPSSTLQFKGRQFTAEVILWAVRWYLMFPISYRDLELMLQDRGVEVDHTTLFRWIQAYAPELEKRIRRICCKVAGGLRKRRGRVQIRPQSQTGLR